jgi:hypothetical protein
MIGAGWMFMCFLVFASCGQFALKNDDGTNNQSIGYVMIIFSCLFVSLPISGCRSAQNNTLTVHQDCCLCVDLGPHGMGCHGRDLPFAISLSVHRPLCRKQLALQLVSPMYGLG